MSEKNQNLVIAEYVRSQLDTAVKPTVMIDTTTKETCLAALAYLTKDQLRTILAPMVAEATPLRTDIDLDAFIAWLYMRQAWGKQNSDFS